MDRPPFEEFKEDSNSPCPPNANNNNRDVHIQLHGTHITSTETESFLDTNKKNVKFADETVAESKISNNEENLSEVIIIAGIDEEKTESDKMLEAQQKTFDNQFENICQKCKELSKRSAKIKDLDTLQIEIEGISQPSTEILVGGVKRKNSNSDLLSERKHSNRCDHFLLEYESGAVSGNNDFHLDREQQPSSSFISTVNSCTELFAKCNILEHPTQQEMSMKELKLDDIQKPNANSVSTTTICWEVKSLGCQTQLSECASVNAISLAEASSLTSRCDQQPNSLNNYAQAENACIPIYSSQHDVTKEQPLVVSALQQPLISAPTTAQVGLTEPAFNVITIETNLTPSSVDLRRTPFCKRFWEMVGDFCAATFLCLQVNRDCIFCLGFFAAFVVSASFLTAFFYHTLILSPSLWQPEENF